MRDGNSISNRNGLRDKRHKMISRATLRSQIQRAADVKRVKLTCTARTVELLPPQIVGDERNKLLYVIALGLLPNCDTRNLRWPTVTIKRLNPAVEAEARAKTRKVVHAIFEKLRTEYAVQARAEESINHHNTEPEPIMLSHHTPSSFHSSDDDDSVSVMDLVSSDDDDGCTIIYERELQSIEEPVPSTMLPERKKNQGESRACKIGTGGSKVSSSNTSKLNFVNTENQNLIITID